MLSVLCMLFFLMQLQNKRTFRMSCWALASLAASAWSFTLPPSSASPASACFSHAAAESRGGGRLRSKSALHLCSCATTHYLARTANLNTRDITKRNARAGEKQLKARAWPCCLLCKIDFLTSSSRWSHAVLRAHCCWFSSGWRRSAARRVITGLLCSVRDPAKLWSTW